MKKVFNIVFLVSFWAIQTQTYILIEKQQRILTNKISLKPRQSSSTTFRICGTRVKILRGRTQRSIINNCAPEFGGTLFGIQHKNTKLVWKKQQKFNVSQNIKNIKSHSVKTNTMLLNYWLFEGTIKVPSCQLIWICWMYYF